MHVPVAENDSACMKRRCNNMADELTARGIGQQDLGHRLQRIYRIQKYPPYRVPGRRSARLTRAGGPAALRTERIFNSGEQRRFAARLNTFKRKEQSLRLRLGLKNADAPVRF